MSLTDKNEIERLRELVDHYERGLISTPYTRALVDQVANRATQYYMEVVRLNRVVARQSRVIKFLRNERRSEPRYTLTDLGNAYRTAMQSGAKLNGEVKAGEGGNAPD